MKCYDLSAIHRNRYQALLQMSPIAYSIGKVSKPKEFCGPLCAFSSYESALKFAKSFTIHSIVLLGKGIESPEKKIWVGLDITNYAALPADTILLESFTPLEEVYEFKESCIW